MKDQIEFQPGCDYNQYQQAIEGQLMLDPTKWTFKSDGRYTKILEHVSVSEGYGYLNCILDEKYNMNEHKDFLYDICKENDKYGLPNFHNFENFGMTSPTNLRYILHSLLIISHMINCKLKEVDIVEIGGGYGGLSLFLHKL